MRFRGQIGRTLDAKGRFKLPQEYQDYFKSHDPEGAFVLTRFRNRYIALTEEQYEAQEDELLELEADDAMQEIIDDFITGYEKIRVDKQGRVQLSPRVRKVGGMDREIVLLGLGKHFAIEDARTHDEQAAKPRVDVMAKLREHGLKPKF